MSVESLFPTMQTDGVVLLRNFFDPAQVRRANEEVEAFLKRDLEERKEAQLELGHFKGSAGRTILDKSKHLILDFFAKSPTLDQLAEKLLTHPDVAALAEKMVGKRLKLRGYNIRHMTGTADNSAMEWHRDNRGEFNFAILLNETEPEGDAATCYIPGSHLYPYCPFQAIHLGTPYAAYNPQMGYFSKRLAERVTRNVKSAYGAPGDAYLFFGDVWHGRQPNLKGKTGTVLFFAVFPAEIPFPSHTTVEIPPPEVLEKLPPGLRKIVEHDRVLPNEGASTYFYTMEARRKKNTGLWRLAMWERQLSVHTFYPKLFIMKQAAKRKVKLTLQPLITLARRVRGH